MCSVNRRLSTSKQRAETLPERSLTHRAGVIWECETLWTHPALNSQHTHHRVFPLLLSPHQAPPITFLEWNKRCQVASSCNSSVCVKASKIFEGLRIVRFIYKRNKQINKQTRDSFTRTILVASLVFYLENVFNIEISSFSLSGSPVWAVASLFFVAHGYKMPFWTRLQSSHSVSWTCFQATHAQLPLHCVPKLTSPKMGH